MRFLNKLVVFSLFPYFNDEFFNSRINTEIGEREIPFNELSFENFDLDKDILIVGDLLTDEEGKYNILRKDKTF